MFGSFCAVFSGSFCLYDSESAFEADGPPLERHPLSIGNAELVRLGGGCFSSHAFTLFSGHLPQRSAVIGCDSDAKATLLWVDAIGAQVRTHVVAECPRPPTRTARAVGHVCVRGSTRLQASTLARSQEGVDCCYGGRLPGELQQGGGALSYRRLPDMTLSSRTTSASDLVSSSLPLRPGADGADALLKRILKKVRRARPRPRRPPSGRTRTAAPPRTHAQRRPAYAASAVRRVRRQHRTPRTPPAPPAPPAPSAPCAASAAPCTPPVPPAPPGTVLDRAWARSDRLLVLRRCPYTTMLARARGRAHASV